MRRDTCSTKTALSNSNQLTSCLRRLKEHTHLAEKVEVAEKEEVEEEEE